MSRRIPIAAVVISILVFTPACSGSSPHMYVPADVPPAPEMSEAARDELLKADRENALTLLQSKFPLADVPDVHVVRLVSPSEWNHTFADCMTDEGFASRIESGGVVTDGLVPEQELSYSLAVYTCHVQYPIDPVFRAEYTSNELSFLYDYYVEFLETCLETEGATVADPPSEGKYVEDYKAGSEWNPYDTVTGVDEEKFYELMKVCPRYPEGFRGY